MSFVPARRDQAFLRFLLWGESGGGKSYTALLLLSILVSEMLGQPEWVLLPKEGEAGQPKVSPELERHIAVIDGEGRLREYAGGQPFWFSVEEPTDFKEDTLLPILDEVRRGGFSGLLFDPFSHVWQGQGGTLAHHSELGGSFKDWGPAKASYRRILSSLLALDAHFIATARAKVEKTIEGKQVVSHGLQPIGEEGVEYEFSLVGKMQQGGDLTVMKSSAPQVGSGEFFEKPGRRFGLKLCQWVGQGVTLEASTYLRLRAAAQSCKSAEAAEDLKALYLLARKEGKLTIREGELVFTMLKDVAKRLGLSKVTGGAL